MHNHFRLAVLGLLTFFAITAHAKSSPDSSGAAYPSGVALPTFSDSVKGYAWANAASAPSYVPSPLYSYNASGGGISISRSETGRYSVTFAGLGSVAGSGHVQVSTYGTKAACSTTGWGGAPSHLVVEVACRNNLDALVDAQFTVMFVSSVGAADVSMAYAWAHDMLGASYTPSGTYSYNGTGGAITANRSATGRYTMRFAGVGSLSGGHVQVTAYGSAARCQPVGWSFTGTEQVISVRCFDAGGNPVDSRYTVLFLGFADGNSGFAWANNATSPSYTPQLSWSDNPNGPITATRSTTGSYGLRFEGLGGTDYGGTVLVSAYGDTPATCNVVSWYSSGNHFRTWTMCFDPDDNLIDTPYTILAVWPNRRAMSLFANGFESSVD